MFRRIAISIIASKSKHEEKHGKGVREESKLIQECLPTGKLSSQLTKKSYSTIFPTNKLITVDASEGEVVSTQDKCVIFNKERQEFDQLAPCPKEEADARLMVHIYDIYSQVYEKAMERNVDTGVVVIVLSKFNNLANHFVSCLCMTFFCL